MDYLDPKKKRDKKARLLVGYGLLGIALVMATVIFYQLVNGYYIDSEGEVIQNGLVFIDSKPETASVYLNGELQGNKTDTKLVVPADTYNIELRRDGYHPWTRKLRLEGASLRQITYARLTPLALDNKVALELPALPVMASQTPDKRWLVLAFKDSPLLLQMVDLKKDTLTMQKIPLPLDLVEKQDDGVWSVIDWADDNRHFLAAYTSAAATEYVIIDREAPEASVNVREAFIDQDFDTVSMQGRKFDSLLLHDLATGNLFSANITDLSIKILRVGVAQYEHYGMDAFLYVASKVDKNNEVQIVFSDGGQEISLRKIKADESGYLLALSKQGNSYVMGVGSTVEGRIVVFKDPVEAIKRNQESKIPVATTVLRVKSPEELTISPDASVIFARGGSSAASHEFNTERTYKFALVGAPDVGQKMAWADGQHATYSIGSFRYIIDFDGNNEHKLSESDIALGTFFDESLDWQLGFLPAVEGTFPPRIIQTFLRTAEDR